VALRRALGAPALAGALALSGTSPAVAATQPVRIDFADYAPSVLDALPGDTVTWSNGSQRTHTVTADSGAFGSGNIASGQSFSWTFAETGTYAYHCTIHPGMTGEVDVRPVTLEPVPPAAVAPGTRVDLSGRTATPALPVRVERTEDGTHFQTVATVSPTASGDWSASVPVRRTADLRAATPGGVSETRRVLVRDRRVHVRLGRRALHVSVSPDDPGGRVVLQLRLREHFGWWTVARKHLDFVSEASFRARRRVPARVVLVDRDGWSPLATSRVLRLGGGGAAPRAGGPDGMGHMSTVGS
jgi:plastocyanin